MDKEKILGGVGGFLGILFGGVFGAMLLGEEPKYWSMSTFIGCGIGLWIGKSIGQEMDKKI